MIFSFNYTNTPSRTVQTHFNTLYIFFQLTTTTWYMFDTLSRIKMKRKIEICDPWRGGAFVALVA